MSSGGTFRLDEVCNVEYGTRVVQKRDGGATYPVYGGGGATFKMDVFNREDRLVVARFGMSEQCTRFVKGKFFLNDSGLTVSPRNGALAQRFLDYHLLAKNGEIFALGKGSAQKNLDVPAFRELKLSVPSTAEEQQRIVAILDEAFAGIATAKANAEKNLQHARAIFESHLQSVFTQQSDDWFVATIGEVCTLRSGTTVSTELEKPAGDLPYLKVADMAYAGNEGEIRGSSRFLSKSDVGKKSVLPAGTTIFPKRGGSILTNKKRMTAVPVCADLNIMGVIPGDRLLPKYLYFYFLNVDMRRIGSGSSIPQINNYDIEPLEISFPQTKEKQGRIVLKLDELAAETQRLETIYQRKLAALDALKQSLLHQAFSGQL